MAQPHKLRGTIAIQGDRIMPIFQQIALFKEQNPEATEYCITTRDEAQQFLLEIISSVVALQKGACLPEYRNAYGREAGRLRGMVTAGVPEKYFREEEREFCGLKITLWDGLAEYEKTTLKT